METIKFFTFSKSVEKKTGALTGVIFSFCIGIGALIIEIISGAFLTLRMDIMPSLNQLSSLYYTSHWLTIQGNISIILMLAYAIIFVPYGVAAMFQLTCSYTYLEGGTLLRLKWRRGNIYHNVRRCLTAMDLSGKLPDGFSSNYKRTIAEFADVSYGIFKIQNEEYIKKLFTGETFARNIECIALENIEFIKQTKKKIIILADIEIKNKIKRKKLKIYNMFNDMDILTNICKGGVQNVN